MTDEQWRLVLSMVFNGPIVVLAVIYVRMMRRDHRAQRDQVSLRAYLVAIALLAAVMAYVILAVGLIDADAGPVDRVYRTAIFAMRVVIFSVLVIVVRSYRKQNRVVR